jgi:hypothetical protein
VAFVSGVSGGFTSASSRFLAINRRHCSNIMSGKSSKEPTRHQLSSRLQYNAQVPAFLRKLQNRTAGVPDEDEEEDPEYEYDGSGRPPIPKRPAIPERPVDDPGSADEDDEGEAPQIVVLKEGKHLSEREVENERRKGSVPSIGRGWTTLVFTCIDSEGIVASARGATGQKGRWCVVETG